MQRRRLLLFSAIGLFGSLLSGCGSSGSARPAPAADASSGKLRIVCTTAQVGDLVRNVGGEHVQIETLMGPSVDPHLYRASLGDSRKLSDAQVVFYSGLHLEGRMVDVLDNLAQRKPAFALTAEVRAKWPERLRKPPEFEGGFDPHVWFDVALWSECAEEVVRRLQEVDPPHAADYRRNADAYRQKLAVLHTECQEKIAQIPAEQRVLVTAHDAFGYFGQAYGIEVHGLQGISTVDEADLENVKELVGMLVKRKIKAVFVESSVPEKNILGLIERCEKAGHKLVKGPSLYSDAMGASGAEATYIGMVQFNVNAIVAALK